MKFVFTCDDVGAQQAVQSVEWFEKVVEWLNKRGIPATFFWVPKPGNKPSDESKLWMGAIRRARQEGHEFELHGLTHHCLEFGVPQESIRRHAPKTFDEYEREREKWQKEHTLDALKSKFDEGIRIYERSFGQRPLIFRAPCLGICGNAYRAMFQSGIRYSSSRSVNPAATGYVITRKPELEHWQPDYDGKPFEEPPGVLEIPCLEDLVIRGFRPEEFDFVFKLFQREISNYAQGLGDSAFGVFASHYHSIGRQMDMIPPLYERLFDWMEEQGVTEWTTFREVLA